MWGTHHHLSSRKACTLKVPQRKSHANDNNNKITQIHLLQYRNLSGKKHNNLLTLPRQSGEMSTEIWCCNSELCLTPCGLSWKLAFILPVCGRASFLTAGVWLNMHLPIKVGSLCSHSREGWWCKHWKHDGGIIVPRVRSFQTQGSSVKLVNLNFKSLFSSVCH